MKFAFVSRILALAFAGALALGAAGCTNEQIAAATKAACAGAAIGTTVYVQVESQSGGATAQKIANNVQSYEQADCSAVATAVTAATASANAIAAAGGTATVTVSTSTPAALKRHVVAKAVIKRGIAGKPVITVLVQPAGAGIPVIGGLIDKLGAL